MNNEQEKMLHNLAKIGNGRLFDTGQVFASNFINNLFKFLEAGDPHRQKLPLRKQKLIFRVWSHVHSTFRQRSDKRKNRHCLRTAPKIKIQV